MRQFVTVVVCVCVAVGLSIPPATTAAFLGDRGVSGQNRAHGGTLDVKLDETGPANQDSTTDESGADVVHDTWEDLDHSTDGSDVVNNTLAVNNTASSLDARTVNVSVSFAENDTSLGTGGNANDTATTIGVEAFVYDGTDLVGTDLTDQNGNGKVDVSDLTFGSNAANLSALSGVGSTDSVSLTVRFSGTAGLLDSPSGDGIDLSFAVRGTRASLVDEDTAVDSTIRYA